MTEDDTFRKLKQLPFDQMKEVVINFWIYDRTNAVIAPDALFEKHGWTLQDYIHAHTQYKSISRE